MPISVDKRCGFWHTLDMDISTNRPANANPALLPLEARRRYQAISDAQKAVTRYKSTRTLYANRPSAENCYHLNRAENTLVSAVRNAASGMNTTTSNDFQPRAKGAH